MRNWIREFFVQSSAHHEIRACECNMYIHCIVCTSICYFIHSRCIHLHYTDYTILALAPCAYIAARRMNCFFFCCHCALCRCIPRDFVMDEWWFTQNTIFHSTWILLFPQNLVYYSEKAVRSIDSFHFIQTKKKHTHRAHSTQQHNCARKIRRTQI